MRSLSPGGSRIMFTARVTFGRVESSQAARRTRLLDVVEGYLASLAKNGQLSQYPVVAWEQGCLTAYAYLARPDAFQARYHSSWSRKELKKIVREFRRTPQWTILDDATPTHFTRWQSATSLYLFTHAFDHLSPICHGDTGEPVPVYLLLPLSEVERDRLYHWAGTYRNYDDIWLASGALEIPAYRQIADPSSGFSTEGRRFCRLVERKTGIPTYYYLMRYWGRKQGEVERLCPSCGRPWRTDQGSAPKKPFHQFPFRCKRCRLVSHQADSEDNARYAKIGEYRAKRFMEAAQIRRKRTHPR